LRVYTISKDIPAQLTSWIGGKNMALIELRNVDKIYKTGKVEFQALKNIHLPDHTTYQKSQGYPNYPLPVAGNQPFSIWSLVLTDPPMGL